MYAGDRGLVLTQDGHRALSASDDGTLRLWDPIRGRQLRVLQGHSSVVAAVAVTLDGRRAVSASWDETLRVWDLETGSQLRVLEGHADWVYAVQLAPRGQIAVSVKCGRNGTSVAFGDRKTAACAQRTRWRCPALAPNARRTTSSYRGPRYDDPGVGRRQGHSASSYGRP
jgi:WD40 repeat protein